MEVASLQAQRDALLDGLDVKAMSTDDAVALVVKVRGHLKAQLAKAEEANEAGRAYCRALLRGWELGDGILEGTGGIIEGDSLDELFDRWASLSGAHDDQEGEG